MGTELYDEEWEAVKAEYGLPELPEEYDGPGARQLVLFRQSLSDENIVLADRVSLDDAREYCSREDTHGPGWFVGFDRVDDEDSPWEPDYGQDELLDDPND